MFIANTSSLNTVLLFVLGTNTFCNNYLHIPTRKAAGPDRIPNEAIKAASEAVATPLANAATTYLLKGKIPDYYKETIIVILRKVNKKDYLLLGSYRPVALENTLGKILEKIVVKHMQKAIEAQGLLL